MTVGRDESRDEEKMKQYKQQQKSVSPPNPASYAELIELARREDLGAGDVSSELTISAEQVGSGELVVREGGVVCGLPVVAKVLACYDEGLSLEVRVDEGQEVVAGTAIAKLAGSLRSLLAAERVMLNFLQRLSGIATTTAEYVSAVEGLKVEICDTRKTTPGWRDLEKYAVRCGGGCNHRYGLYDAVLIKDNHLAALGGGDLAVRLREALQGLKGYSQKPDFVEVEVDDLEQLGQVLQVEGVDMVLLDNMTSDELCRAVAMRDEWCGGRGVDHCGGRLLLEASGNVTLATVRQLAETGVDRISVGALTHTAGSLDVGFDLRCA